ncbi:cation diffusion facilitator family transporter [Melioribacteraceae bacterium 4301-Me]|uniref:cation diffusion facilitator family transporter n=1 Tax=Pyranulibacter aquaticus TaxID=3163344 RepID=UPI003595BFE8
MNSQKEETSIKEKRRVAVSSIIAAIFLTTMKFIVGLVTGSLGILSEALHSLLDLFAATITFLAVKYSDLPPDKEHQYGHGKFENYSALVETGLLGITCFWIIYEAVKRIITKNVEIEVTFWSFAVVIISVVIDSTRSRALYKVAKKHNSQALEADALHFSTDIWSSMVVLFGLIGASLNYFYADSIAALIVALIVLSVTYRLGKKSFDALVDKAPIGLTEQIDEIVSAIEDVKYHHNIKVRESGPYKFVEINIHVDKKMTIEQAHAVSHIVEEQIKNKIPKIEVTVHTEPDV